MKYYSELTDTVYDSVEALEKAEAAKKAEDNEKEAKDAERKRRAEEVNTAFEKAREAHSEAEKLLKAYREDYGQPKTVAEQLFSMLFN